MENNKKGKNILTYLFIISLLITQNITHAQKQWITVGSAGFSSGKAAFTSLAIDSNNTPFVAYVDSNGFDIKATVMKFDGNQWIAAGNNNISTAWANETVLTIDQNNIPYVAFEDDSQGGKITVMKLDSNSWKPLGKIGFSVGAADFISLAISKNNIPYVAFRDWDTSGRITVMKYEHSNWDVVGHRSISSALSSYTALAIDSNNIPYVAYYNYSLTVKKFDSSKWILIDSPVTSNIVHTPSLAFSDSNTLYLAYQDNKNKATMMKLDSNKWSAVGHTGFTTGHGLHTSLVIDGNNIPYVSFSDGSNTGKATLMKYDNNQWTTIGKAGFSPGSCNFTSLAFDKNNTAYVAFKDFSNGGKVTVMKYAIPTYVNRTNNKDEVVITPNPAHDNVTINVKETIKEKSIRILNMKGETVFSVKAQPYAKKINISLIDLPNGVYIIDITGDGKSYTKRLVKHKPE